MDQKLNDNDVIAELNAEAEGYISRSDFNACIERMKWYEAEWVSPAVRFIALLTHARCAMDVDDFVEAKIAVETIDRNTLSIEEEFYMDKIIVQILEHDGEFQEAKRILLKDLARLEIMGPEMRDVHYDMLGVLVRVSARLGEYEKALAYFEEGESSFERGPLFDNYSLYKAYCLQMLGHDIEAESCIKKILHMGSGAMQVDAFYELGLLYWRWGRTEEAQSMLELAWNNLPHGTRTAQEIRDALSKLHTQVEARKFDGL